VLNLGEGELLIVSELLPDEEYVTTRFYREWLKPRGLHHLLSLIVCRTHRHITGLSLLRRPERPPFSRAELACIQRLLPHLQRVVQLQEMLAEAEQKYEVAHQVLDSLRCGAILLDGTARVCGANERAAALLKRREGMLLEGTDLRAEDPQETPALQRLVRGATRNGSSGGVLALSRAGRHHPLVVSASPLRQPEPGAPWLPVAKALVLVSDPEELPILHEAALRELYGLTPCEARVASMLAHGEKIGAIATSLGVQRTTVRTHVQRALEKTGTHRQAELVRLLLTGHGSLAEAGSTPSLSS
jgi:DNA-binding CsgD family transcriptional regulator/PAS domain-containing protein